jgi:predicted nucleic acid-binding protein
MLTEEPPSPNWRLTTRNLGSEQLGFMTAFTAFYDANVLYPAELRNLLMHLALTGLFRAKWSADVHEEWITSLLKNRPDLDRAKLERTQARMDRHAEDALVTGYQDLIPGLHLPDPDDRHILAAAIRGRADVIVTMNLRDFPQEMAETHRQSLKNPQRTRTEYLETLQRQCLTKPYRFFASFRSESPEIAHVSAINWFVQRYAAPAALPGP